MSIKALASDSNKSSSTKKKPTVDNTYISPITPNLEVECAARDLIRAAFKRGGIGIDDYVRVIREGMSAGRKVEKLIDGIITVDTEPDHQTRIKSALVGAEMEGYLKCKASEASVTNNFIDVKALIQQFNKIPTVK